MANCLRSRQDYLNVTSMLDDFDEGCGEATPYLYSVANLEVTSGLVHRNLGAPMYMRGPGAVPGLYALESAMNELADELKMDPLKLANSERRRNRRRQEDAVFVAAFPRVLRSRCEEIRLGASHAGDRLNASRRQDSGMGSGRRKLGCPDACPARRTSNSMRTAASQFAVARRISAPAPTRSLRRSSTKRPAFRSIASTWFLATALCPTAPCLADRW